MSVTEEVKTSESNPTWNTSTPYSNSGKGSMLTMQHTNRRDVLRKLWLAMFRERARTIHPDPSILSPGNPESELTTEFISLMLKDGERFTVPIATAHRSLHPPSQMKPQRPSYHHLVCNPPGDRSHLKESNGEPRNAVINNHALQIAMCISEEIARLSDAPSPIPTDMSLQSVGLDSTAIRRLNSWLFTRYDWKEDISLLASPHVSSETLAKDITTNSAPREAETVTRMTRAHELGSSKCVKEQRRLRPRRNLSVTVPEPEISCLVRVTSSSSPGSPEKPAVPHHGPFLRPSSPRKSDRQVPRLNTIGMVPYKPWTNKKSGMVVGFMTLGALLGSPYSPSLGMGMTRNQRTPLALSGGQTIWDVRSPPVDHTSILSPWLNVLHFHDYEPVQSPWVANQAQSEFPLSP